MKALVYQGPERKTWEMPVTFEPAAVKQLTSNRGVHTAIEAVGLPASFELCQSLSASVIPLPIWACMEKLRYE